MMVFSNDELVTFLSYPILSFVSPGPCYSLEAPGRTHSLGPGRYLLWLLVENESDFINLLFLLL